MFTHAPADKDAVAVETLEEVVFHHAVLSTLEENGTATVQPPVASAGNACVMTCPRRVMWVSMGGSAEW